MIIVINLGVRGTQTVCDNRTTADFTIWLHWHKRSFRFPSIKNEVDGKSCNFAYKTETA